MPNSTDKQERNQSKERRTPGRPARKLPGGWLSAKDISALVGYGDRWVRRHLGHLATKLNGRDYRWRDTVVLEWLKSKGLMPSGALSGNIDPKELLNGREG